MAEQVQQRRRIKTEIKRLRLDEVKTLDEIKVSNARYMKHETYQRLVSNLKKDGELTSVPFAIWWEYRGIEAYVILSGNHRVKAGRDAGIEDADFKVTHDELSWSEIRAVQLSHNAIEGEDDPATIKEIYGEIEDVEAKMYAALDDKQLELLDDVQVGGLTEAQLDYQAITIMFLPNEAERIKEVLEQVGGAYDEKLAARMADYDRWMDAVDAVSHSFQIKNVATAVGLVLDVFENHIEDLQDGFLDEQGDPMHGSWVPLTTVFGNQGIPADVAAVLARVVKQMRDRGEVETKSLWRALEIWAAEYDATV